MQQVSLLVTRRVWDHVLRQLEGIGEVRQWPSPSPMPREEFLARIADVDGLLCMDDDRIDRELLAHAPRLQVVSTVSADTDHIDLAAATERGVAILYAPGAADHAVADMTMALLLACARQVVAAHHFVMHRQWEYWHPELFMGTDVQGSTVGIIGLGHIGMEVAHRTLGFGMRVLYFDFQRDLDAEQRLGLQFGSLENVLREADFVTLHMPLTVATRRLISASRLRLMKPSAYLINTARGAIIDHVALVRALREGWIAGAGLDVYPDAPLAPTDPLLDLPNVVLTPHIGANTKQAMATMLQMATAQLGQYFQGERPAHAIVWPPDASSHAA
jgi:glyoxylate reductase